MILIIFVLSLFLLKFFVSALPLKFPKFRLHPSRCSIFYGGPGSGKTTLAAFFARKAIASGIDVYSNVPISGCKILEKSDIGRYDITDGLVIIDEAGIDYNNRDFKNNFTSSKENQAKALEWWKKHRHEGAEVLVFSQGFDDMDKKIQGLGSDYYIVRRSLVPGMIVYRRILKRPQIDEHTRQPIDAYDFAPFSARRVFMRPLWRYFDSFDRMHLPPKEWDIYRG